MTQLPNPVELRDLAALARERLRATAPTPRTRKTALDIVADTLAHRGTVLDDEDIAAAAAGFILNAYLPDPPPDSAVMAAGEFARGAVLLLTTTYGLDARDDWRYQRSAFRGYL